MPYIFSVDTKSWYAAQADLESMILMPQTIKCWYYSHETHYSRREELHRQTLSSNKRPNKKTQQNKQKTERAKKITLPVTFPTEIYLDSFMSKDW